MTDQLELSLRAKRETRGPEVAAEMQMLLRNLHAEGTAWATRELMRQRFGYTDRECRLGRQHSHGKIIAGQRGYRLTEAASLAEITAAAAALESQAKVVMGEANELWRIMHQREAYLDTVETPLGEALDGGGEVSAE